MDGGITGNYTTLGVPDLFPGEVVQIGGFAPFNQGKNSISSEPHPFNGPFGVIEVRHSVGNGGFQTRFKAVSGVFNTDLSVAPGQKEQVTPEEEFVRDVFDKAGRVVKKVRSFLSNATAAPDDELIDLGDG